MATDPSAPSLRQVEIRRAARIRNLSWALSCLASMPAIAVAVALCLDPRPPRLVILQGGGDTPCVIFALLFVMFLAGALVARLTRERHRGALELAMSEGWLRVRAGGRERYALPRAEVGVAWMPAQDRVEILTVGGDEVTLRFQAGESAARWARALSARARERRAYPVTIESDERRLARKGLTPILVLVPALFGLCVGGSGWLVVPTVMVLAYLGMRGSRTLELGADGALFRGRLRKRLLPYRDISAATLWRTTPSSHPQLAVLLADGRHVTLGPMSYSRRVLVAALLTEGVSMARAGAAAAERELSPLAQCDGESHERWAQRLLETTRGGGYRARALDPEMLLDVMRNPAADVVERIAAAIALRGAPHGARSIRAAAEVTIDPDVKEYFVVLGEDDVDEVRFAGALRALAEDRRG
jgi:hypothetical protein